MKKLLLIVFSLPTLIFSQIQIGQNINGEAAQDQSGLGVSLSSDGTIVATGSRSNGVNGANSGQVRVYDLSALLSSNGFVLSQFNIYPNPVKEQFTIKLSQGLELQKVNIYNSLGQLISSTTKNSINTVNLSQGLYFIEIETTKGKATKKIIIE